MIKNYVLDTNIILQSPDALEGFDDNNVFITGTTLQELDQKKSQSPGEVGYHAREAIRILDALRKKGNLREGVRLKKKGTLFIYTDGVRQENLPQGFSISAPDNRILSACIELAKSKSDVILVTNDVSMRVSASVLGIRVEEYRNVQVDDTSYTGHTDQTIAGTKIDALYRDGMLPETALSKTARSKLMENEFLTLHSSAGQSAMAVYRNHEIRLIREKQTFGGIKGLNILQKYAIWALSAPPEEIPLVILSGVAGTAKTLLSLAVGMEYTYSFHRNSERYNKILLSRPNGIGYSNIGFLPGDLDQKLSPLMASYYDNMEVILSSDGKESRDQVQMQMDDILESNIVELCSLDFIRGRSLKNTYIICDEAQNASRTLIRDVITRAGEGTKVVIAGDPGQIDVPSLDRRNCGLSYAASAMAGDPTTAIVCFSSEQSVRSTLARAAIERLR